MKMCVGGKWVEKARKIEVLASVTTTHVVDTVPHGDAATWTGAGRGGARREGDGEAHGVGSLSDPEEDRREDSKPEPKSLRVRSRSKKARPIAEGAIRGRAARCKRCTLSAEEARRIHGETMPLGRVAGRCRQVGVHASACRAAWSWRSLRSIFRSTSVRTKSARPSRRETPWSSSRRRTRRCRR